MQQYFVLVRLHLHTVQNKKKEIKKTRRIFKYKGQLSLILFRLDCIHLTLYMPELQQRFNLGS